MAVTIKLHKALDDKQKLSESSSDIPILYALGIKTDSVVERITPFVKCKDYLHDVLYSYDYKTPVSVHGFHFDPSKVPLNKANFVIFSKGPSEANFTNQNHLRGINEFAAKYGLSKTELIHNGWSDDKATWYVNVFDLGKEWASSPMMLSLFLTLHRINLLCDISTNPKDAFHTVSKLRIRDAGYAKRLYTNFDILVKILKNLSAFNKAYASTDLSSIGVYSVHNSLGISETLNTLANAPESMKHLSKFAAKYL